MPKVYHRGNAPADAVYVGHPSFWGNPYKMGPHGTRTEVVRLYHKYLLETTELLERLPELKGKDLSCWCAPLACHADILLELANKVDPWEKLYVKDKA